MLIIIKDNPNRFHSHYNRTLGKYYYQERDYVKDLKARNLEPYDPSKVKKREKKEYKPSKWARDIVNQVQSSGYVSGSVMNEINKQQIKNVPKDLLSVVKDKSPKGGWF